MGVGRDQVGERERRPGRTPGPGPDEPAPGPRGGARVRRAAALPGLSRRLEPSRRRRAHRAAVRRAVGDPRLPRRRPDALAERGRPRHVDDGRRLPAHGTAGPHHPPASPHDARAKVLTLTEDGVAALAETTAAPAPWTRPCSPAARPSSAPARHPAQRPRRSSGRASPSARRALKVRRKPRAPGTNRLLRRPLIRDGFVSECTKVLRPRIVRARIESTRADGGSPPGEPRGGGARWQRASRSR